MEYEKGDIWILSLPNKGKKEQQGIRPGIILSDTKTGMILTIPLTSNISAQRFPHTLKITKSKINNLEKDSIALIFQMQSLDKKRFLTKIGKIENQYLNQIDKLLKDLFFN